MDFNEVISRIIIPALFFIVYLYIIIKVGECPAPLPKSKNPKKNILEVGIYTPVIILFLTLKIFFLDPIDGFFYISLGLSTIIFLLIPLIYTHYKDHWTSKDLGINSKVKSWWVVYFSIILSSFIGFYNTFTFVITWHLLLIYFYSNAFIEEFVLRGVIQSKLERALGQKKAITYQGLLFMFIHIPVYTFEFSLDGNFLRFLSKFGIILINGIIFGLIYLKTRNIWVSVICHYLNNWFGAIITHFLYFF